MTPKSKAETTKNDVKKSAADSGGGGTTKEGVYEWLVDFDDIAPILRKHLLLPDATAAARRAAWRATREVREVREVRQVREVRTELQVW